MIRGARACIAISALAVSVVMLIPLPISLLLPVLSLLVSERSDDIAIKRWKDGIRRMFSHGTILATLECLSHHQHHLHLMGLQ